SSALGEPHVAQTASEQATLSLALGNDAQRAEALVDDAGVDALTIVSADEFVPPTAERRHADTSDGCLPRLEEVRIGRPNAELDPPSFAPGSSDRRVGVRHQLGDDLCEIDPCLREVLAEIASADASLPQLRGVDRHGRSIK